MSATPLGPKITRILLGEDRVAPDAMDDLQLEARRAFAAASARPDRRDALRTYAEDCLLMLEQIERRRVLSSDERPS